MEEMHLSAFHSISNRARETGGIIIIIIIIKMFCLMPETVRRSRYMIWLTFT